MFISEGNDPFVKNYYLTTYNNNKGVISATSMKSCLFFLNSSVTRTGYKLLPRNISSLNEYTCGPLNRKVAVKDTCVRTALMDMG